MNFHFNFKFEFCVDTICLLSVAIVAFVSQQIKLALQKPVISKQLNLIVALFYAIPPTTTPVRFLCHSFSQLQINGHGILLFLYQQLTKRNQAKRLTLVFLFMFMFIIAATKKLVI